MTKLKYALSKGFLYKKVSEAVFTYVPKCEIKTFIGTLEGNEAFKDRLVKFGKKISERLTNPESELIRQIRVNYDLIEVNGGFCLSLSKRDFVEHPIQASQIGLITPRAYFNYDHLSNEDSLYFREILENSLSQCEIAQFCEDFLGLFNFQGKQHKQKAIYLY